MVHFLRGTSAWVLFAFGTGGCSGDSGAAAASGLCTPDPDPSLQCSDAGLAAYACTGSARPDEQSTYVSGIPLGKVCTDLGSSNGSEDFCCTQTTVPCAYDPTAICAAPAYGYECRGYRPEAFDPNLFCGEGLVKANGLIDFCCSGQKLAQGCMQASGGRCPNTLVPWNCTDQTLPSEAELGSNQSRADFNLLVCSIPTVMQTGTFVTSSYCCYTPIASPAGASCVEDTKVPGCAPGSFGFACSGFDTPDQDYPRITCPDGGVAGTSAAGFSATIYCCQFN